MNYDWEKDLKSYTSEKKINELCRLVDEKIIRGKRKKWLIIVIYFLIIMLLIVFIGVKNILEKGIDLRNHLITGIIAFIISIGAYISPIKSVKITKDEINNIIGTKITKDIIEKITKTVEQKTSKIEKCLGVISALGVFLTVILKLKS